MSELFAMNLTDEEALQTCTRWTDFLLRRSLRS